MSSCRINSAARDRNRGVACDPSTNSGTGGVKPRAQNAHQNCETRTHSSTARSASAAHHPDRGSDAPHHTRWRNADRPRPEPSARRSTASSARPARPWSPPPQILKDSTPSSKPARSTSLPPRYVTLPISPTTPHSIDKPPHLVTIQFQSSTNGGEPLFS